MSVFTAERNSPVISVANFIPSKFGTFPQAFWKVDLHTRLNVHRERERERERERAQEILGL